jgi:phosphoserine phosphatase
MKYKLIVFDMDGVIFDHRNFWMELHEKLGTYEEGLELTRKYVKTNYAKLVEEVVNRLWKGKKADGYRSS